MIDIDKALANLSDVAAVVGGVELVDPTAFGVLPSFDRNGWGRQVNADGLARWCSAH